VGQEVGVGGVDDEMMRLGSVGKVFLSWVLSRGIGGVLIEQRLSRSSRMPWATSVGLANAGGLIGAVNGFRVSRIWSLSRMPVGSSGP